jgi:hypothetical protein
LGPVLWKNPLSNLFNRFEHSNDRVRRRSRYAALVAVMVSAILFGPYVATLAQVASSPIPPSLEVYVGYGDTEGRGAGENCSYCFPSPWCGSPGVQFVGSSTNYDGNPTDTSNCMGGDWDGGAVRVINTGTAPITLTNLTVTLPLPASGLRGDPSCASPPRPITFKLWFGQQYYFGNLSDPAYFGSPITVPPLGQAIFAGTSSDGSYTCPTGNYPSGPGSANHATYDFDTSDANFLSGCTPTNDTVSDPRITFSAVGYSPTTYIDVGHTIDTGGIDTGNCSPTATDPQWGHEDLGWRPANDPCGETCPGGTQVEGNATTATTPSTPPSTTTLVSTATVTASSGSGVSYTVAYGIAAVAGVFIVATAYLATRKRG